ncbi:uncharacterized protein ASPGLDRAFT_79482 [Aspergillus glaucus CBS 516.65]|uniref:Uncharacterized protein n=1 Tax=Aspergillus glaucus CBS 516.65 TaxID=1160497 RepID=A0A1L9VV04_ASPGL|nr:hypothetical protein ASPGLDRAFT_79482 [Aspergillus glaucus CBS 516.65]OJJ87730.1 hypothetical protein ASPGLDRAFT_79482 [Aspergillus glaucus CBS 516.65]
MSVHPTTKTTHYQSILQTYAMGRRREDKGFLRFRDCKLKDLYRYDRDKIYDFLETEVHYSEEPNKTELDEIRNRILALSLGRLGNEQHPRDEHDGTDYTNSTLPPAQHIRRRINPDWKEKSKTISKFHVDHHEQGAGGFEQATDPKARALKYWSPYDLLGLFLSRLDYAPVAANEDNFFLPLTAVYGKWCSNIAGNTSTGIKLKGVGDPPFMFQCTWVTHRGDKKQFFLGASLAGYEWAKESTGTWESELKLARFNLVRDLLTSTENGFKWTFDSSRNRIPVPDKDKKTGKKRKSLNQVLWEAKSEMDVFVQAHGEATDAMPEDLRTRFNQIPLAVQTFLRENYGPYNPQNDLDKAVCYLLEALGKSKNIQDTFRKFRATVDQKLWKRIGTRFGNCAETYPFLNLLQPGFVRPANSLKGFALSRKHFFGETPQHPPPPDRVLQAYDPQKIANCVETPCDNFTNTQLETFKSLSPTYYGACISKNASFE